MEGGRPHINGKEHPTVKAQMEAIAYVAAELADLIDTLFGDRLRKSRAGRLVIGMLAAIVVFYYLFWLLDLFPLQ